jgi:endoplasmic reticulum-Golgi intermediate compartment protein 3
MDISGEHQLDVSHNIYKKRLGPDGNPLMEAPEIKDTGI